MKQDLEKTYNPNKSEDKIYQEWEKSGFFNPDNLKVPDNAPNYTIILPPPNITDRLHLGHAVMVAIEDLLIRYHRLRKYRTLWLPGTDHAAIATQNVVEKKIFKETGQTRNTIGHAKFLEEVQKFLEITQATILHQIKKLGASLDWSRLAFTLDNDRQLAVRTMFQKMYDEGIIYRGERVVNWCPRCHSTLADDEVEHRERPAILYTFKYSQTFPITISTTRPETKLGDSAIAVNPKDKRYQQFIGQQFTSNFCGQKLKIKVIADYNVDPNFGTGALGVTPAHSMVDWQMAQENNLKIIKVVDEEGNIRSGFGKYSELNALEARRQIVEDLKQAGLMDREEEISNNLAVCYRCDTPIEPLPSRQWFVAVDKKIKRLGNKSLKEKAIEVVRDNQIKFIPERFNKRYLDWMENLHDWCISRQIWFGHRIPVWYKRGEIRVQVKAPPEKGWRQDSDTLDTWFSSGMWTFSTLGWPDKAQDLAKFHPTQVLETGYEIITLWVSRMVMMSLFALEEIPFEKVYLHGMILDKNGKKMAKSKGNGIDPLAMIKQFGTDATRLSLLTGSTPGNDARFSIDKVEAKRNFINKLWNISRYILNQTDEKDYPSQNSELPLAKTLADRWILEELGRTISIISQRLDNFEFSLAVEDLMEFTRDKLADWYLEIAKVEKGKAEILLYILRNLLKLWHPFVPFVTEKIWQNFNDTILMVEKWPSSQKIKTTQNRTDLKLVQEIIIAIRNARSENKIQTTKKLTAVVYGYKKTPLLKEQQDLIKNLKTGIMTIEFKKDEAKPKQAIVVAISGVEIYLLNTIDGEKEKRQLKNQQTKLEQLINSQRKKLANSDFIIKAPQKVVRGEQEKLSGYQAELKKINNIIN